MSETINTLITNATLKDYGRFYNEAEDINRTSFQRDRDRIIHSKAFRRLSSKTQVLTSRTGDNYRTRLTHTLEVTQISRSVAQVIGLNQDLVEVLALAHDLGHSPFAHTGQEILNKLMIDHGGFEHNCQGLRQLTKLEENYIEFSGLNLTKMTLMGMMKHEKVYEFDEELKVLLEIKKKINPILETKLVDICDRITYLHHDLQDALDSKILDINLLNEMWWWRESYNQVKEIYNKKFLDARIDIQIRTVIRFLLKRCVEDLITTTLENYKTFKTNKSYNSNFTNKSKIDLNNAFNSNNLKNDLDNSFNSNNSKNDIINLINPKNDLNNEKENNTFSNIISLNPTNQKILKEMHSFLFQNFYKNKIVLQMSEKGTVCIEKLFIYLKTNFTKLPLHYQKHSDIDGLDRTVCDYIAGMTDSFAQDMFASIS